jgi:hypothetical protein
VDAGESLKFWSNALDAFADVEAARASKDAVAYAQAWDRLRAALVGGHRDWTAWREAQDTIETLRKVSQSERKRLVDMHAMVTADEAMAFAGALVAVVRQHVADPATFAAIQDGMKRVFEERRGRAG